MIHLLFRTFLFCLILFLNPAIRAEEAIEGVTDTTTTAALTETSTTEATSAELELSTSLTPDWFKEREKLVTDQSSALEKDRTERQTKQEELQEKIADLEANEQQLKDEASAQALLPIPMSGEEIADQEKPPVVEEQPITEEMIKEIAAERDIVNTDVENLRLEKEMTQSHLEKAQKELETQQKALDELIAAQKAEEAAAAATGEPITPIVPVAEDVKSSDPDKDAKTADKDQKSSDKKSDKSSDKDAKTADKDQKSSDKKSDKSSDKDAKTADKDQKSSDKKSDKSSDKDAKTADKDQKSSDKKSDKSSDKDAKTADKDQKSSDKKSDKSSDKDAKTADKDQKSSDKESDKSSDKDAKTADKDQKSSDKKSDKSSDKDAKTADKDQKSSDKKSDKSSDKDAKTADKDQKSSDKESDKSSDKDAKTADKDQKSSDKKSDKSSDKESDKSSDKDAKTADKDQKSSDKDAKATDDKAVDETTVVKQETKTPDDIEAAEAETKIADKETALKIKKLTELEGKVALLKEAIAIDQRYLEVLKTRYELANQYLKVIIQWHDKLKTISQARILRDREKGINELRTSLQKNQETLQFDKEDLPNKVTRLETAQIAIETLEDMLDKAALDKETSAIEAENLKLEVQSLESNLQKGSTELKDQEDRLEKLSKTPFTEPSEIEVQKAMVSELENRIALQTKQQELDQQDLELLKQRIDYDTKLSQVSTEWYDKLQIVYQARRQRFLELQIQKEQQGHLTRALELRKQLEGLPETASSAQRFLLKMQTQEANERAQQAMRRLQLANIQERLEQGATAGDQKTADIYQKLDGLQLLIGDIDKLSSEMKKLQEMLQGKVHVYEQQLEVAKKQTETIDKEAKEILDYNTQTQQVLEKLVAGLQQELNKIPPLQEKGKKLLETLETSYRETLQQSLFRIRKLPSDFAGWEALFQSDVTPIPRLFIQQGELSWQGLVQAAEQTEMKGWLGFGGSILGWLIFLGGLTFWVRRRISTNGRGGFITQGFFLGLRLINKNALSIALVGGLLIFFWLIKPTAPTISFILSLALGGLIVKLFMSLIRLLFLTESIKTQSSPVIYWQLQGAVLILGILAIVVILMHIEQDGYVLKASLPVRDLADTLFMLLLSLMVLPLMRLRQIMLTTWKESIQGFSFLMMKLMTLLVPMTILVTSLLGVVGYINLGWNIAKHLSLFLIVLVGGLISGGILTDLITIWKKSASKDTENSLLAESIIPLIHKVLSLSLIALAVLTFFWITGWYSDVATRKTIAAVFEFALFSIGGSPVTVGNILLSLFVLWIVFWLSGWSRQVTYQFIYQNIVDVGVRNSLSVFTQYAVILIGFLIALNIIGINLTTLTVFAGAIGVGIGFGLRDVINNFISGILLLVERPLRSGDFIDVAGNQGIVKQIGIRSLMIRAIDGRDIMIPNSEVISRTFTNWTYTDKLRRTTVCMNISYHDDPKRAKEVVEKVLAERPEILKKPAADVYLQDYTDFSMKLCADYFIDSSRNLAKTVKSKVLFDIWERLREAGIYIPYPQQDVHLKTEDNPSHQLQEATDEQSPAPQRIILLK